MGDQVKTLPRPETKTPGGTGQIFPRHFVELDHLGNPMDETLCGKPWDRLFVRHNGEICQDCVDEMRKRDKRDREPQ